MPNIAGPETLDTLSIVGNCLYPAKLLGGKPFVSPNVRMEGQQVKFYNSLNPPSSVMGIPIDPLLPCGLAERQIEPVINNSVLINGQLFAMTGDVTELLGIIRPLTGPYSYPTIKIGTQLENS
jgi:hypothetical protein